MRRRTSLLIPISVLLAAQVGRAEDLGTKERRARTACLAGDYAQGVRILSELFVATMDVTFIYNQARCFEQNRRYEDAIARFQEFLRAGKRLTKADRAQAQKHIDDCKELLAGESSRAAKPAPVASPAAPVVPAPPPAQVAPPQPIPAPAPPAPVAAAQPQIVQQTSSTTGEPGSAMRTAGVITASVGAAAVITGVILNLKVNNLASDLQKTDGYSPGKESDRKSYEAMGWVSYGVGAACVATGAVLYILGLQSTGRGPNAVALLPALAPGHAGAFVKGAF